MNENYEVEVAVPGVPGNGKGHEQDDDNCVLWVGNLDSRTTENMVFELFCQVRFVVQLFDLKEEVLILCV